MVKSEADKQLAGEIYNYGDPEFIEIMNRARDLTSEYNSLKSHENEARDRILRKLLGKVGANVYVDRPFCCDYGCRRGVQKYIAALNCTFTIPVNS
jgi:maltose O-acetyltransferase